MTTDRKFPTEVIDLPSKGWFYNPDGPLASGQVELKYMTAREEDILTSLNLIQKGVVIDRLLKAVVVSPIDIKDLLVGDKNGILIACRILAYGKDYPATITCRSCQAVNSVRVDLTALEEKTLEEPEEKGKNEFTFVLPATGKKITYRILTHGNDEDINIEMASQRKLGAEVEYTSSTRLKYIIQSIDGNYDQGAIREFVDNELISRDAHALRAEYSKMAPDMDLSFPFKCNSCEEERRMQVPLGIDFFWPVV